jgi:hypothetical protein
VIVKNIPNKDDTFVMAITLNDSEGKPNTSEILPFSYAPQLEDHPDTEEDKFELSSDKEFIHESDDERPRQPLNLRPQEILISISRLESNSSNENSFSKKWKVDVNKKVEGPLDKIPQSSQYFKAEVSASYNYNPKLNDFTSDFDIDKEVEDLKNKVQKNLPSKPSKRLGKNRRGNYKNFIPQSKDEIEMQESGPDKIPSQDLYHKKRSTKEYEQTIEKEKVAKILGPEQVEKISKPLTSKLKKHRSKSQERRKKKSKKVKSPNKKRERRISVNIAIQEDDDLRKSVYKNRASKVDSIASNISDFNDTDSQQSSPKIVKEKDISEMRGGRNLPANLPKSTFSKDIKIIKPNPQECEDKAIKDNLITEGKSYCNQNCRT